MSAKNAMEVVMLEAVSPAFRAAFRNDAGQTLNLFANELLLDGGNALTASEIDGILSISDDEFKAFSRIASAVGTPVEYLNSQRKSLLCL